MKSALTVLADRTAFSRVDRNIFVPQVTQRRVIFASIERGLVATWCPRKAVKFHLHHALVRRALPFTSGI